MNSLNPQVIYEKAVQRYLNDVERIRRQAAPPTTPPQEAVDMNRQVVSLASQDGEVTRYSFKLDKRGHLRFRPDWDTV